MAPANKPRHFVVDGSNIATEGRTQPSLNQLNEAVMAFMQDYPGSIITVVVDATFGHRIDKKEASEFDEAVANNELVTPPAGAIGRGDAFVLTIANKANADVLSNDSFQEFHGKYEWLFDEGRLIGGKPVPHVGWVFVDRNPVRGPKSRMAVREAKKTDDQPASSPQGGGRGRSRRSTSATSDGAGVATPKVATPKVATPKVASPKVVAPMAEPPEPKSAPPGRGPVNQLMPFLEFVERHPVGTSCTAVVEIYASHGAYARVGDVLVYIPLRLMADPAPRSARSALNLGDALAVVIVGYVAERRSIDAALPAMAASEVTVLDAHVPVKKRAARKPAAAPAAVEAGPPKRSRKKPVAVTTAVESMPVEPVIVEPVIVEPARAKTRARKPVPKPVSPPPARPKPVKQAAAKKAAGQKTPAHKAPAQKTPAQKVAANNVAAKKAVTKKVGS